MRTSPEHVRRTFVPRALPLAVAGLLAVGAVACGDDEAVPTTPSTTAPSSTEGVTTEAGGGGSTTTATDQPTTSERASSTVPGDGVDVLTEEQATAQLQTLLTTYRAVLLETRGAGRVDEATASRMANVYSGREVDTQVQALSALGAAAVAPTPPALEVSDLRLTDATGTCAAGSAVVPRVQELFVDPVPDRQPYYFRLVPAAEGAASPGWRIDLFNFSTAGPLEAASCD